MVRRFELTEENGNARRFELSDLVVNPTLPDRLFQFTPPPGAVVVDRG
jgi:outer membrane lipoprotein-sorting protein